MNIPEIKLKVVREKGADYSTRPAMKNQQSVIDLVRDLIGDEDREHLIVLLLDRKNKVNGFHTASIGTVSASMAHPREIFKAAIVANASGIILAHNHPSGDTTPSIEDFDMTKKIKKAGVLLGIPLIDHIVISYCDSYSFQAHQKI